MKLPWSLHDLHWRIEQLPAASRQAARGVYRECLSALKIIGMAHPSFLLIPNPRMSLSGLLMMLIISALTLMTVVVTGLLESSVKTSTQAHVEAASFHRFRLQRTLYGVALGLFVLCPSLPLIFRLGSAYGVTALITLLANIVIVSQGAALTHGYAILLTLLRGTPGRRVRAPLRGQLRASSAAQA